MAAQILRSGQAFAAFHLNLPQPERAFPARDDDPFRVGAQNNARCPASGTRHGAKNLKFSAIR